MTTQNEAVNVEIVCTIGLDREVYAQEETKEIDGVRKKEANAMVIYFSKR